MSFLLFFSPPFLYLFLAERNRLLLGKTVQSVLHKRMNLMRSKNTMLFSQASKSWSPPCKIRTSVD